MSLPDTPEQLVKPGSSGPAGPYEFLTFVAGSLGKGLPIVVVLALIAGGAFYGLRQISEIQSNAAARQEQLNKRLDEAQSKLETAEAAAHNARAQEIQAKADAASATSNAKNQFLLDYSKQLKTLAEDSENMSKSLQQLVGSQITNMQALQKAQADQEKEAEAARAEQAEKSKADLAALQAQIREAQQKEGELAKKAQLAGYTSVKADLDDKLQKNLIVGDEVNLLLTVLNDDVVNAQAVHDAADTAQSWQIRLALNLQLYKKTSRDQFLDATARLMRENAARVGVAVGYLFTGSALFTETQLEKVVTLLSGLVMDQTLPLTSRDAIAEVFYSNYQARMRLSPREETELARYVGTRLVQLADFGEDCPAMMSSFPYFLSSLNAEAAFVYEAQALKKLNAMPPSQPSCIRLLEPSFAAIVAGHEPTQDQLQRWQIGSL